MIVGCGVHKMENNWNPEDAFVDLLANTHVFLISHTVFFGNRQPQLRVVQKQYNLGHCYYIITTSSILIFNFSTTLAPPPTPMLPSSSALAWPTFVWSLNRCRDNQTQRTQKCMIFYKAFRPPTTFIKTRWLRTYVCSRSESICIWLTTSPNAT
jgi:hypothetical protein